jgi:hypothetical protein
VINVRGVALSPVIKAGVILPPAPDLLQIMAQVTGRPPVIFPVSTYDILGGHELPRLNSILRPATRTTAPVVGVALTAETAVAGTATGANQAADLETAARFCLEVAKAFGRQQCTFYDVEQFATFTQRYGRLEFLQGAGQPDGTPA